MNIPDEDLGMEIPEDVEEFANMNYRTNVEKQVNVGLKYCIEKWELKNVFKRGFYDLMICNKEFYRTYVKNGVPYAERLDPRQVIYDVNTDQEMLQDCLYAGIENWYTANEIIDRYKLSDKEIEKIEEMAQQTSQWYNDHNRDFNSYIIGNESSPLKIKVVEFQWRSIKKMVYKVSPNKYDPEIDFYKMMPDDYKKKGDEDNIVTKGITEIRQCTKIGHDCVIDFGAKPNQIRYEENYSNTQLDFFGVIRNNFNGTTLSIVDTLKNIQLMYNYVMYHIDSALARTGGKAIIYDVSQKPKNVPLSDVMYHAKNSGLILINSKQEGGQMSTFNQWKDVDFTLSQSVGQLINLKSMLEDTADKLTGISSARAGINKASDAVGVNERSVMQSTLITAPLFDLHYTLVGQVLQSLANQMRYCWGEKGYQVNIFGDMGYQTFKIDKAVSLDEYGIFVNNNSKEIEKKGNMMGLLSNYASSGALDPLLAIKAVNAESAAEVETILTTGLQTMQEQQQQMQQQQQQIDQQANEINAQKAQVPLQVAQINAEASIKVAEINSKTKLEIAGEELDHKEDMQDANSKSALDQEMLRSGNQESMMAQQAAMQRRQAATQGKEKNVNVKE
jgi:hypothetical protein